MLTAFAILSYQKLIRSKKENKAQKRKNPWDTLLQSTGEWCGDSRRRQLKSLKAESGTL